MVTNICDLGDNLLAEILCRLPCDKFVFQIKCVSKKWCTLVSEPYFIGRFLRLQSEKQTPKAHGVVDSLGNELFPTKVFERFRSFLCSKKEARVLAICNDLVLCVENRNYRDFYICNPRTMQLVSLPPTPTCHKAQPWGFICEPYYNNAGINININAEYRFKVVKILTGHRKREKCFKFDIQVFSSETGEWREITVPCLQGLSNLSLYWGSFGNNGILYWVVEGSLLALRTPFFINNNINGRTSTNVDDDDQYQFHVIDIDLPANHPYNNPQFGNYPCLLHYIGVYGGRVRLQDCNLNEEPLRLCVWELKEEELDQRVVDGTRKLGSEHMKSYALDQSMIPEDADGFVVYKGYDPNEMDVVYITVAADIVKCNIRTGSWSKMAETSFYGHAVRQFVLPWWPTPVPRLLQRSV